MNQVHKAVQQVIRERETHKVLGDPANPVVYSFDQLARGDRAVKQAIHDSGWAPFHYDRKHDGLAEPWRAYWLDCACCRRLAQSICDLIPEMKPGNKMPALLAGCGSLVLFTWLPQAADSAIDAEKLQRVNREHLAATAAAVQNFLLLLTADGIKNYWSSGSLIADHLFESLGISSSEILAAAVFAHYPGGTGEMEILSGKQRGRRSPDHAWLREIKAG